MLRKNFTIIKLHKYYGLFDYPKLCLLNHEPRYEGEIKRDQKIQKLKF